MSLLLFQTCDVDNLSYFSIIFTPKEKFTEISGSLGQNGQNKNFTTSSARKQLDRILKLNLYDKVLNIISILVGVLVLFIIYKYVSATKITKKVTDFIIVLNSVVLLSYNVLLCFGQLFFSPKSRSGCLAVAVLQHWFISVLFTIITWGSIIMISAIIELRPSNLIARFFRTLTSNIKYVIFQSGALVLVSFLFPLIFVSIAASKKTLYSGLDELTPMSEFAYLEMIYFPELDDTVCFIQHKSIAFKTLMYGQWSTAMLFALIAFALVIKNG